MKWFLFLLPFWLIVVGQSDPTPIPSPETTPEVETELIDLTQLWSYGLISIRTGEPIIEADGLHNLDESIVEYGYNIVVDRDGNPITPSGQPLHGGEQLIRVDEYQDNVNVREQAHIFTLFAPIRDNLLYRFDDMTEEDWIALTEVLTLNGIKVENSPTLNRQSILSSEQVYEYVISGDADGSPIMRYLEEAELELKCLAFQDFDFTNPEGANHCDDHSFEVGSGIILPDDVNNDD